MAKSTEKADKFRDILLLFSCCRQAKKINKVEIARQIKAGGKQKNKKTFSTLTPSGDSEINGKNVFGFLFD